MTPERPGAPLPRARVAGVTGRPRESAGGAAGDPHPAAAEELRDYPSPETSVVINEVTYHPEATR